MALASAASFAGTHRFDSCIIHLWNGSVIIMSDDGLTPLQRRLLEDTMRRHDAVLKALARGEAPWPYSVIPDEKLAFRRRFGATCREAWHIFGPIEVI
jgi:hypothetical protein